MAILILQDYLEIYITYFISHASTIPETPIFNIKKTTNALDNNTNGFWRDRI